MDLSFFERYEAHYPRSRDTLPTLVGLVVGQFAKFTQARSTRKRLYKTFGKDRWNLDRVEKEIYAITPPKTHETIRGLVALAREGRLEKDHCNLKGVDSRTTKAYLLMNRLEPDVFLLEDKWVNNRLRELLGREPTIEDGKQWVGYRSLASLFFWRVTADGIAALKCGEEPTFV